MADTLGQAKSRYLAPSREEVGNKLDDDTWLDRLTSDLWKGSGASASKLDQLPDLLEGLGVENGHEAIARLKELLDLVEPRSVADALRNAYGWGNDRDPLLTRRRGNLAHDQKVSIDTIGAWEIEAAKALRSLAKAGKRKPEPDPRTHYSYEYMETRTAEGKLLCHLTYLQRDFSLQELQSDVSGLVPRTRSLLHYNWGEVYDAFANFEVKIEDMDAYDFELAIYHDMWSYNFRQPVEREPVPVNHIDGMTPWVQAGGIVAPSVLMVLEWRPKSEED